MTFIESEKKCGVGDCTNSDFIGIGAMFMLAGNFFMKVKDNDDNISYTCLNSGRSYNVYQIIQAYDYENAIKINGKMEWWKTV